MTKQEVLQNCTVEGMIVRLPTQQLDRKIYEVVAKSLYLIGGKWQGGKVFGFVFQVAPTDLLESLINDSSKNIKKEYQFFATPAKLANELVYLADLRYNDTILEPSAGQGALIKAINEGTTVIPDCYELLKINRKILKQSKLDFNLIGNDFLTHKGEKYTKIIATPPFRKNQDIDHLRKMYDFLAVGGRLVCITSNSWVDGNQTKHIDFRDWLSKLNVELHDIEKGTFKESGTMVGGKILVINKK